MQAVISGALDVAKNILDERQMTFTRIVHMQADLLNSVGYIWPSEGEVLKCPCRL